MMATQIMDRLKFPPYHIDALYHLSPSGRRMVKGCEVLQKYTRDIIEEHKQQQRDQVRGHDEVEQVNSFNLPASLIDGTFFRIQQAYNVWILLVK